MATIGVIGTGNIGMETVTELQQRGHEVIVLSRDSERAEQRYLQHFIKYNQQIHDGIRDDNVGSNSISFWEFGYNPRNIPLDLPLDHSCFQTDYSVLSDVEFVISTAAIAADTTRANRDVFFQSALVSAEIAQKMKPYLDDKAIVITPVNPVELQTEIYRQFLEKPSHQIIGAGTAVDSARMEFLIRNHIIANQHILNIEPGFRVASPVSGLHRNDGQIFSPPCVVLEDTTRLLKLDKETLSEYQQTVQKYGWELVKIKREQRGFGQWDNYGPAVAMANLIDALCGDQPRDLVATISLSSQQLIDLLPAQKNIIQQTMGDTSQTIGLPVTVRNGLMEPNIPIIEQTDFSQLPEILKLNIDTMDKGYQMLKQNGYSIER